MMMGGPGRCQFMGQEGHQEVEIGNVRRVSTSTELIPSSLVILLMVLVVI